MNLCYAGKILSEQSAVTEAILKLKIMKKIKIQKYFQKMCRLRPIQFQAPSWNAVFLLALFMLKPSPCFSQIAQKGHICIYKARLICKGASTSAKLQHKDKRTEKSCFQLQAKKKKSPTVTPRTKVLFFHFLIICPYQAGLWLVLGDKREHKERRRNKTSNRNVEN